MALEIRTKRIYEPAAPADGVRLLVDRVWPRGLRKDEAMIVAWLKEIAPSTALAPVVWAQARTVEGISPSLCRGTRRQSGGRHPPAGTDER